MKNGMKYMVMATLIGLTSVNAWADQTNLVRTITINLSGFEQGSTTTSKNVTTQVAPAVNIGNTDIIAAIGVATGESFSTNAQLVVVTSVSDDSTTMQIRDGANQVDVTAFFGQNYLTSPIEKSTSNSKTGKGSGSYYSLDEFFLADPGSYNPLSEHYDVSGMTTEDFTVPAIPGPRSELKATVSGTGDLNGNPVVLSGTIKVTGQTVEVISSSGLPPA